MGQWFEESTSNPMDSFIQSVHSAAQQRVDVLFRLPVRQGFARLAISQTDGTVHAVCCRALGSSTGIGSPAEVAALACSGPVAADLCCATRVCVTAATWALRTRALQLQTIESALQGWQHLAQWTNVRYVLTMGPLRASWHPSTWSSAAATVLCERQTMLDALQDLRMQHQVQIGLLLRLLLELSVEDDAQRSLEGWMNCVFEALGLGSPEEEHGALMDMAVRLVHLEQTAPGLATWQPPGLFRHWLSSTMVVAVGLMVMHTGRRYDIVAQMLHVARDLSASARRFWQVRVTAPLAEMYATIRYDERQYMLISARTLKADLESLQRMVLAYGGKEIEGTSICILVVCVWRKRAMTKEERSWQNKRLAAFCSLPCH